MDGKPTLLKPDYFAAVGEKKHGQNFYVGALHRRIAAAIHEISPNAMIAQEPSAFDGNQKELALGVPGAVSEPHFYDGVALLSKHKEPDTTYPIFSTNPLRAATQSLMLTLSRLRMRGRKVRQSARFLHGLERLEFHTM